MLMPCRRIRRTAYSTCSLLHWSICAPQKRIGVPSSNANESPLTVTNPCLPVGASTHRLASRMVGPKSSRAGRNGNHGREASPGSSAGAVPLPARTVQDSDDVPDAARITRPSMSRAVLVFIVDPLALVEEPAPLLRAPESPRARSAA